MNKYCRFCYSRISDTVISNSVNNICKCQVCKNTNDLNKPYEREEEIVINLLHDEKEAIYKTHNFEDGIAIVDNLLESNKSNTFYYFLRGLFSLGIAYHSLDYLDESPLQTYTNYKFDGYDDVAKHPDFQTALYNENNVNLKDNVYLKAFELVNTFKKETQNYLLKPSINYDVFISYKKTPLNGDKNRETESLIIARRLYNDLRNVYHYNPFFSDETKTQFGSKSWEKTILQALFTAKCFVIVTTEKGEDLSPWIRYEWSTYKSLYKIGEKPNDSLIVFAKNEDVVCDQLKDHIQIIPTSYYDNLIDVIDKLGIKSKDIVFKDKKAELPPIKKINKEIVEKEDILYIARADKKEAKKALDKLFLEQKDHESLEYKEILFMINNIKSDGSDEYGLEKLKLCGGRIDVEFYNLLFEIINGSKQSDNLFRLLLKLLSKISVDHFLYLFNLFFIDNDYFDDMPNDIKDESYDLAFNFIMNYNSLSYDLQKKLTNYLEKLASFYLNKKYEQKENVDKVGHQLLYKLADIFIALDEIDIAKQYIDLMKADVTFSSSEFQINVPFELDKVSYKNLEFLHFSNKEITYREHLATKILNKKGLEELGYFNYQIHNNKYLDLIYSYFSLLKILYYEVVSSNPTDAETIKASFEIEYSEQLNYSPTFRKEIFDPSIVDEMSQRLASIAKVFDYVAKIKINKIEAVNVIDKPDKEFLKPIDIDLYNRVTKEYESVTISLEEENERCSEIKKLLQPLYKKKDISIYDFAIAISEIIYLLENYDCSFNIKDKQIMIWFHLITDDYLNFKKTNIYARKDLFDLILKLCELLLKRNNDIGLNQQDIDYINDIKAKIVEQNQIDSKVHSNKKNNIIGFIFNVLELGLVITILVLWCMKNTTFMSGVPWLSLIFYGLLLIAFSISSSLLWNNCSYITAKAFRPSVIIHFLSLFAYVVFISLKYVSGPLFSNPITFNPLEDVYDIFELIIFIPTIGIMDLIFFIVFVCGSFLKYKNIHKIHQNYPKFSDLNADKDECESMMTISFFAVESAIIVLLFISVLETYYGHTLYGLIPVSVVIATLIISKIVTKNCKDIMSTSIPYIVFLCIVIILSIGGICSSTFNTNNPTLGVVVYSVFIALSVIAIVATKLLNKKS